MKPRSLPMLAIVLVPLVAAAHARLMSSTPSAGATLSAAPQTLELDFNESVQLAMLKVSAAGTPIPVAFDHSASAARVVAKLPPLDPGTYQVQWSALTVDDGHVVKGSFSFIVRP